MDPYSPNKLIATKYCFLILGDVTSFFFLIISLFFFSFLFLLFYVILLLLIFTKIILLLFFLFYYFFFSENYFYFIMFRDVPACSGMFPFPGFTDAHFKIESESQLDYHELPSAKQMLPLK